MPNAWLNHVRQFRKNNKNMSYKQLLKHAKNSYGGANQSQQNQSQQGGGPDDEMDQNKMNQSQQGGVPPTGMGAVQNMIRSMTRGGSYQGMESRSSLTRSASSVGGRRSRKTRRRRR
jgi:hypothetical protein